MELLHAHIVDAKVGEDYRFFEKLSNLVTVAVKRRNAQSVRDDETVSSC